MMDTLSTSDRSARMSRIRATDSKPEMTVRRLLHRMGYRYRLHRRDLPGTPDIVFASQKKAIFVHGCFWHRHQHCHLARMPKTRQEFWGIKLDANRLRDLRNESALADLGWHVLVVWECELRSQNLERKLVCFLENDRERAEHEGS